MSAGGLAGALGGGQNGSGEFPGGRPALIQFCDLSAEELSAYLDDDATAEPAFEQHARTCSYCGARPRGGAAPKSPLERLWRSIENTLRDEGVIRSD